MVVMKISAVCFLWLGGVACSQLYSAKADPPFELLEATSQQWISGVPGGGRGNTYKFRLKANTDLKIAFDSIWVDGKQIKLSLSPDKSGITANNFFASQDTIQLFASDYTSPPVKIGRQDKQEERLVASKPVKAPIAYKGAALLRYTVENVEKFYIVPRITSLPTIHGQ